MFLVQDVLVPLIIVFAQILIGRLFFREWKKLLPPRLASLCLLVLCFLWTAVAIGTLLHFTSVTWALRWSPAPLRSALSAFGNVWGMASLGSLVMYYGWRLVARNSAVKHSPGRRKLIHAAGLAAAAAPFAVAGFGAIVNRTNFQIREIDLPVPGLHPDLEGLRIGQLSDLHVSPWLSVQELGRAIDMLNELKPHLTVVTGDLITQVGDPLDDTIRELSRLRADAGILGCLGNHEMYAQCQNYTARHAQPYGIGFLRHEARLLRWGNGVLNVAGVDYQRSREIRAVPPGRREAGGSRRVESAALPQPRRISYGGAEGL